MKEIKVSTDFYVDLINYFYPEDGEFPDGYLAEKIRTQIADKMDRITTRDLFSKYKTAKTPEEREKARLEYLRERGISDNFISSTEERH